MTGAEEQVVLNTLTEHDYQDAFNKWQKSMRKANRPILVFDQTAALVPHNMEGSRTTHMNSFQMDTSGLSPDGKLTGT